MTEPHDIPLTPLQNVQPLPRDCTSVNTLNDEKVVDCFIHSLICFNRRLKQLRGYKIYVTKLCTFKCIITR